MLASKNAISRKYFQIMHIAIAMHPFHKKYVCIFSTENKVISHQWNRFLLFVNTDYCCWICFCVVFVDFCPTDLFSKMLSYAYLMIKNKNLLVVLSLKFMKKIRIRLSNWTFVLVKKIKLKKRKFRCCLIVIIISFVWLLSFIPWIYWFCFHTSKIQMTN